MEALLSLIDPIWIVVLCGLSCIGGFILVIVLPVLGGALDIVSTIFEVIFGIVSGDPISCCGCIVAILACGVCGLVFGSVALSCGTTEAVNFCRLF